MSEQHGGVMNRIENSRAGFVARYWRAAAYERPEEREPDAWAMLALVPLLLVLPLAVVNLAAQWIVATYPAYFPDPDTPAGFVLDFLPGAYEALSAVLFGLAVMYLGKLLIRVAEDSYEEVTA